MAYCMVFVWQVWCGAYVQTISTCSY